MTSPSAIPCNLLQKAAQIDRGPVFDEPAVGPGAVDVDNGEVDLPAGRGTPKNSPVWVPRTVTRCATRSPSAIWSSTMTWKSGNVRCMKVTHSLTPVRPGPGGSPGTWWT